MNNVRVVIAAAATMVGAVLLGAGIWMLYRVVVLGHTFKLTVGN